MPRARLLLSSRRALAGIEFAIILPVLLVLLTGLVDLSFAFTTQRRLTAAARDVALIGSTLAAQADSTNTLTGQQAYAATTAPYGVFPSLRLTGAPPFLSTLTEVEFSGTPAGCNANCTGYTPKTRWSVNNPKGSLFLRPCGTLGVVPNGSDWKPTAIPAGAVGGTSILLSDVYTLFTPPLTADFIGQIAMYRSAYVAPRVGNTTALSGLTPGRTVVCP